METPLATLYLREQLYGGEWNQQAFRNELRSGELIPVLPGIFARGTPPVTLTWEQEVDAALLWGGAQAVAAGTTAAALLGLGDFERSGVVTIAVPGTPKPPKRTAFELVVWRGRELTAWDVTEHELGFRMTSVERTLFDLGGQLDPRTHEKLVAEALKKNLTYDYRLRACFKRLRERGRSGVVAMQALFDRRGYSLKRLESDLEDRLLEVMNAQGLPEPKQQYAWPPGGKTEYRLDFAYPDVKLAIEMDGYVTHSSEKDWHKDQTRMNALVAHGWSFLRFTESSLSEPAATADTIRQALTARGFKFPKR